MNRRRLLAGGAAIAALPAAAKAQISLSNLLSMGIIPEARAAGVALEVGQALTRAQYPTAFVNPGPLFSLNSVSSVHTPNVTRSLFWNIMYQSGPDLFDFSHEFVSLGGNIDSDGGASWQIDILPPNYQLFDNTGAFIRTGKVTLSVMVTDGNLRMANFLYPDINGKFTDNKSHNLTISIVPKVSPFFDFQVAFDNAVSPPGTFVAFEIRDHHVLQAGPDGPSLFGIPTTISPLTGRPYTTYVAQPTRPYEEGYQPLAAHLSQPAGTFAFNGSLGGFFMYGTSPVTAAWAATNEIFWSTPLQQGIWLPPSGAGVLFRDQPPPLLNLQGGAGPNGLQRGQGTYFTYDESGVTYGANDTSFIIAPGSYLYPLSTFGDPWGR